MNFSPPSGSGLKRLKRIMILQRDRTYEQNRRWDRQIRFLRWFSWGLGWMTLGAILGRIIK